MEKYEVIQKAVSAREDDAPYRICIERYQSHLRAAERSSATVRKYGRDVERFLRFAQKATGDPVAHGIDKPSLVAWKRSLIDAGYAPQTVNTMLAAVNGFVAFLGRSELRVKPVRRQRAVFRTRGKELTKPEYLRLLAAAKRHGRRRLFLVMQTICATGIRVSELQYITAQSAKEGRAAIRCKGKCRVILIPRKLCGQLLAWAREKKIAAGPLFRTRGGKPIDRSNIWRDMRSLCGDAGVEPGKVFPHNLRHLFAVVFYKAEKDLAKLADVLGHSNISTTRLYIMETGAEHEKLLSMLGLIVEN